MPGFLDTGSDEERSDRLLSQTLETLKRTTVTIERVFFCIPCRERLLPALEQSIATILDVLNKRTELWIVLTKADTPKAEHNAAEFSVKLKHAFKPDGVIFTGEDRVDQMVGCLKMPSTKILNVAGLPPRLLSTRELAAKKAEVQSALDGIENDIRKAAMGPELENKIAALEARLNEMNSWTCPYNNAESIEVDQKTAEKSKLKTDLARLRKSCNDATASKEAKMLLFQEVNSQITRRMEYTRQARELFWTRVRNAGSAAANAVSAVANYMTGSR